MADQFMTVYKARLKFQFAALLKADVSGIEQAIQMQLDLAIERREIWKFTNSQID